jgi:hypothetical protein
VGGMVMLLMMDDDNKQPVWPTWAVMMMMMTMLMMMIMIIIISPSPTSWAVGALQECETYLHKSYHV